RRRRPHRRYRVLGVRMKVVVFFSVAIGTPTPRATNWPSTPSSSARDNHRPARRRPPGQPAVGPRPHRPRPPPLPARPATDPHRSALARVRRSDRDASVDDQGTETEEVDHQGGLRFSRSFDDPRPPTEGRRPHVPRVSRSLQAAELATSSEVILLANSRQRSI